MLAGLPVLAQTYNDTRVAHTSTLILPLSSTPAPTDMARVITSAGRPEECLAPVSVTTIDGENIVVSAQGFFIEAGVHTINGRAMLDITNCPLIDRNPVIESAADLEVEFEPGGTYHIAYHHAPANSTDWKLVVWHVETKP